MLLAEIPLGFAYIVYHNRSVFAFYRLVMTHIDQLSGLFLFSETIELIGNYSYILDNKNQWRKGFHAL